MEGMRNLKQECLKVVMLNTKNIVISIKDVSIGSLNSSIVHPREVFNEAIKKNSASIIVSHNHPSGDPTPSGEDINLTHRLSECGKLIGIELLDHIIIGNGIYISLKEKGIL
jgi:DNA repair protein RadC